MQTVIADLYSRGGEGSEWSLVFHVAMPLHYAEGGLAGSVKVIQPFFASASSEEQGTSK